MGHTPNPTTITTTRNDCYYCQKINVKITCHGTSKWAPECGGMFQTPRTQNIPPHLGSKFELEIKDLLIIPELQMYMFSFLKWDGRFWSKYPINWWDVYLKLSSSYASTNLSMKVSKRSNSMWVTLRLVVKRAGRYLRCSSRSSKNALSSENTA